MEFTSEWAMAVQTKIDLLEARNAASATILTCLVEALVPEAKRTIMRNRICNEIERLFADEELSHAHLQIHRALAEVEAIFPTVGKPTSYDR